jgi:glycosyltransferase involved in cell wall biosynthesis
MTGQSPSPGASIQGATTPAGSDGPTPRVVVFVAGPRARFEAALYEARKVYGGRHLTFFCEPEHRAWLAERPGETILTVERPFNPFGQRAAELLKGLEAWPVEACVIVVADIGFESLRFRLFALRVRTSRFIFLPIGIPGQPEALGRSSFAVHTAGTTFLSMLRRYRPRKVARAMVVRLAAWLSPLDQPLAVGLALFARALMWWRPHRTHQGKEIAHIIPSIGMGGAQRQLVLLLKNRSPAYHHRVVVIFSGDSFFAPEVQESGVPISYVGSEVVRRRFEPPPGRQSMLAAFWSVLALAGDSFPVCREIVKVSSQLSALDPRPDVVHCWLLFANLVGSIAARLVGVPLVITSIRNIQSQVAYNYYHEPRWQRTLERATVPLATAIIANSASVALDYRTFAGAPAEKVITVPNGVEVKALCPITPEERGQLRRTLGLNHGDFVVGTVARLAKEKDFETFLRAIEIARRRLPSLRVIIVGEGLLRAHLETFAACLGLAEVVQFLGGRKDVVALIQCYDIFLLTSIIEGMPNVVMESQLLGVPVVATKAGGTADLIRDGETGLLAPVGDHEQVASGIVRLFTEMGLRDRISRAARDQIQNNYTVEQFVARTENVYRLLTSEDGCGGSPCVG